MKNVTKFGLTTLACLMLAACGSSGGGSSTSNASVKDGTTVIPPSTNNNTQKPTNNATSPTADSKTGNVLVSKGQDDNLHTNYDPQTNSSLTEIIVEGKNSNTQTTNNGTSLSADSKTGNVLVLKGQDNNLHTSYDPQTNSSLTEIIVEGKNSNTQTTNNGTSLTSDSKTGNVLVLKDQDDNLTTSYAPQTNSSLTEIIVEGKKIPTAFPGIYSGGWSSIGQLEVCCGKYSYVRFGVAEGGEINDQAIDSYVFYNGNTTKEMPTSGSAEYKGDLILTAEHPVFDDVDWKTGQSDFHADFGTKQLKGNFHVAGLSAIAVNAKIEGNGFSGTATSSELGNAAQLEGKFYGPKAQELGGLFEEKATHSWGGAFGAKQ